MTQSTYNLGGRAFTAGEDLLANRRVKVESGTVTVPPEVVYADAGEAYIGLTASNEKDGDVITVEVETCLVVAADSFSIGATLYGAADGKVSDTSNGTAQFIALEAATADGDVIEAVKLQTASTTAALVSIADAGGFTSTSTVEAALAEIYQSMLSAQAVVDIPLGSFFLATGARISAFSDGDSTVPGWDGSAAEEFVGIRWNNHATPDPIMANIIIPPDLDDTANVVVHVLAAKTGATEADAVTWTIGALNNADGALYDADSDFGGASSAMTGTATAKTCQEETLTLLAANVVGSPCVLTLTIQPTDGTLGTDDVILIGMWLEYTRKALTA